MAAQGNVVVIGDALIDEIRDDAGTRELIGGAALNVAVGVARLGASATLIAMVGDDEAGDHIREYLRDHGVRLVASPSTRGSSRAIVTRTAAGEPSYVFNEAAQHRSIRFGAEAQEAIDAADVVAVSCYPFDREEEADALAAALSGARTAIDPNPRTGMLSDRAAFVRGFERVAASATLVKIGADDADILYGGDLDAVRRHLHAQGACAVLATAGADGATILTSAGEASAPIVELPGPIRDTVGAGDATLATAVVGLLGAGPQNLVGWERLVQRAMAVAAATCRREGGLLRTPEQLSDEGLDRIST